MTERCGNLFLHQLIDILGFYEWLIPVNGKTAGSRQYALRQMMATTPLSNARLLMLRAYVDWQGIHVLFLLMPKLARSGVRSTQGAVHRSTRYGPT